MMFDFAHLRRRWQQLVEMSAPAGGVFTLAITTYLGKVQNAFKAPTQAAGCIGFLHPNRLQHLEYKTGVDRLDRQLANHLVSVNLKRRGPLRRVLFVFPCSTVRLDVGLSALLERDGLCCFEPLACSRSAPRLDWINTLMSLAACVQGLRAGVCKAIQRERTKPHPPRPAINHVTQHPIAGAFRCNTQIEAAAVSVHAGLGRPL